MNDEVGVELEDEPSRGAGAEAEDTEWARGEEGREGGEDVEVGAGEGGEEEGDAVDVAGVVEEEEAGAGEGVVSAAGDFEDADVVVSRPELGEEFDVVGGDAVALGCSCFCRFVVGGAFGFGEW